MIIAQILLKTQDHRTIITGINYENISNHFWITISLSNQYLKTVIIFNLFRNTLIIIQSLLEHRDPYIIIIRAARSHHWKTRIIAQLLLKRCDHDVVIFETPRSPGKYYWNTAIISQ